jgi:hypothetical protein
MSAKKSASPLAAKILAFIDPLTRRTSDEIAQGLGEDPQAVWLELADLEYRDKLLSELVGSPMVRKYRANGRKKAPKCLHDRMFAIVSPTNWERGCKGRSGADGIYEPRILCCLCGAIRPRKEHNGPSWSISLAEEMSDPLLQRDGYPEGAVLFVHATNLRTAEEIDRAADEAFGLWVDLDYGRRLLYARLRPSDLERAERDAAEYARSSCPE